MHCSSCGKQYEEGQAFCAGCGAPIGDATKEMPKTKTAGAGGPSGDPGRRGLSPALIGGGVGLLVVLIGGIGIIIGSQSGSDDESSDPPAIVDKVSKPDQATKKLRQLNKQVKGLKKENNRKVVVVNKVPQSAPAPSPAPAPSTSSYSGSSSSDYSGYIAQLGSFTSLSSAQSKASQLNSSGVSARILNSSDYSQMVPGYWVVFSGPYSSQSSADSAASTSGISDAFSRYISG